jgi:hypothetical protein
MFVTIVEVAVAAARKADLRAAWEEVTESALSVSMSTVEGRVQSPHGVASRG